jgi:ribonuclease HI
MSTDRVLLGRLADALKAFADGKSMKAALRDAGIDPGQAGRLMSDLAGHLYHQAAASEPVQRAKGGLRDAVAFSDGGSRGNPGEAACGVVICDGDGNELLRRAKRLGRLTNNQAEYEGVIYALELAGQLGAKKLEIRMDSELVVRQLEGRYKVKNEGLKPYHRRACDLVGEFQSVALTHIRRTDNKEADKLVNAALDGKDIPD